MVNYTGNGAALIEPLKKIITQLRSDSGEVREAALQVCNQLASVGFNHPVFQKEVFSLLESPTPTTIKGFGYLATAGEQEIERYVGSLTKIIEDEDLVPLRVAAVEALGMLTAKMAAHDMAAAQQARAQAQMGAGEGAGAGMGAGNIAIPQIIPPHNLRRQR